MTGQTILHTLATSYHSKVRDIYHKKITKYNKTMGIIIVILKLTLVQEHAPIRLCNTTAWPVLCCGSKMWATRKGDSKKLYSLQNKVHENSGQLYEVGTQNK
jgi:hypothetical protein